MKSNNTHLPPPLPKVLACEGRGPNETGVGTWTESFSDWDQVFGHGQTYCLLKTFLSLICLLVSLSVPLFLDFFLLLAVFDRSSLSLCHLVCICFSLSSLHMFIFSSAPPSPSLLHLSLSLSPPSFGLCLSLFRSVCLCLLYIFCLLLLFFSLAQSCAVVH